MHCVFDIHGHCPLSALYMYRILWKNHWIIWIWISRNKNKNGVLNMFSPLVKVWKAAAERLCQCCFFKDNLHLTKSFKLRHTLPFWRVGSHLAFLVFLLESHYWHKWSCSKKNKQFQNKIGHICDQSVVILNQGDNSCIHKCPWRITIPVWHTCSQHSGLPGITA